MSKIVELESELIDSLARLDENKVYDLIQRLLSEGASSEQIMKDMNMGLKGVGTFFENGKYFIADMMFAGMIYHEALKLFLPMKSESPEPKKGRVLIGVVENDIHDIGKDIVVSLLSADNYDIIDLGIDVKPCVFVNGIRRYHPDIVMLSGVMQFARDSMQRTVAAICEAGLREQIFIMLGGGCIEASILKRIDADAAVTEPSDTLRRCNEFIARRYK